MSFEKYTTQKKIKKVVDPGTGDSPLEILYNDPKVVPMTDRDIKNTSLSKRVDDLIELSQNIQAEVREIINEITVANNHSEIFTKYHTLVQENHFNPVSLDQDQNARPTIKHQPNTIKAAERQVYRELADPRAPFVQDLYDHLADAGLSEHVLKNYWKSIVLPNNLYNGINVEDNLTRYTLAKEEQYLFGLKNSSKRIQNNKITKLSQNFLSVMSQKMLSQIYIKSPQEQIQQIDSLINTLTQLKTIFMVVSIFNTKNWEKFSTNLRDMFSDFFQITAVKITKTTAHTFVSGMHDKIFELLDGFDDFLPFGLNIEDVPEAREMLNQVNGCFGTFLAQIEDDHIYREGLQIKAEENRQILISNSQKESKTKQFLVALDTIISYLQEIRATLSNIDARIKTDTAALTQRLVNGLDSYSKPIFSNDIKIAKDDINKNNA